MRLSFVRVRDQTDVAHTHTSHKHGRVQEKASHEDVHTYDSRRSLSHLAKEHTLSQAARPRLQQRLLCCAHMPKVPCKHVRELTTSADVICMSMEKPFTKFSGDALASYSFRMNWLTNKADFTNRIENRLTERRKHK